MTKNGHHHRVFWSSGEKCEVAGTYFSMCCGIRLEFNFVAGDTFVRCPDCRKKIKWERVNTAGH
ncbi:MAG TPA: hypothetical protein VN625_00745 [Desulfuromonadaceae bacterium]|nr:hypothetical protein [Desulfuromonadaceae bacterium]